MQAVIIQSTVAETRVSRDVLTTIDPADSVAVDIAEEVRAGNCRNRGGVLAAHRFTVKSNDALLNGGAGVDGAENSTTTTGRRAVRNDCVLLDEERAAKVAAVDAATGGARLILEDHIPADRQRAVVVADSATVTALVVADHVVENRAR